MSNTVSLKMSLIAAIIVALIAPAFTFAATPTVADLQTQYQTLLSQFESLKEKRAGTNSSTEKVKERKASSKVDRSCMATAVATRETSIKTAWTTFTGSIESALEDRSKALVAGWNTDSADSVKARKEAWDDWKTSSKAAHTKLKSERKVAWETFKKTAKDSCKVKTPKEEGLEKSGSDSIAL